MSYCKDLDIRMQCLKKIRNHFWQQIFEPDTHLIASSPRGPEMSHGREVNVSG
jgi:hypothetical protein